jgi:GH24 family phage-related lysozyme (muramidase)
MRLYTGVVENRQDPLKLGRCQVRIVGLHHHDKNQLKSEDLPWAYPMQPITSAGISGIGHSPLGPVEGSAVVIFFRDDDEQQPIIMGSIGGIPQAEGSIDSDDDSMVLKEDGLLPRGDQQVTTNSNGEVTTNTGDTAATEETGLNPASSYTASADCVEIVKRFEGLRLNSYQDSAGIWTIGYGTTRINGMPVTRGMTITQAQADQLLLDHLNADAAKAVQSRTKSLITQSMFDALTCFTYNVGQGTYGKSTLLSELNSDKYLESANQFSQFNKATIDGVKQSLPGLTARRTAEKDLFLKDGIPTITGDLKPTQNEKPPVGSTPTANGLANGGAAISMGFKDPKGKYPLYLNEPDTNKLARHEDIKKTIVRKKELARYKQVETAQGKKWDQSFIPYNSQYPYNHVFMTESGHVMEFDDTEKSERVHIYHKSGTYEEIDANGTKVTRIIGNKYEILERNGHLYIKGTADVTIDGDHNVKINNALNIDVVGNVNINVNGNMNVDVAGSYNLKADSINLETHNGPFNILAVGSINQQTTTGAISHKAAATFNVDAVRVDMNSGTAGDAVGSALETLEKKEPEMPEFTELIVLTRGAEANKQYETPEDGDPTEYVDKQIKDGTLDPDTVGTGAALGTAAASPNNVQPTGANCDLIFAMEKFTPDLQLSPHFTLGALTKGGARQIKAQMGLSPQQIVCNLKGLAENCLEPIIKLYPATVITSGYRSPGDVPKSSTTSRHYYGEAADIVISGFNKAQMYEAVQEIQKIIPYDQLILEYAGPDCWIHCSFKYSGNRKMAFTMRDHKTFGQGYTLIA